MKIVMAELSEERKVEIQNRLYEMAKELNEIIKETQLQISINAYTVDSPMVFLHASGETENGNIVRSAYIKDVNQFSELKHCLTVEDFKLMEYEKGAKVNE